MKHALERYLVDLELSADGANSPVVQAFWKKTKNRWVPGDGFLDGATLALNNVLQSIEPSAAADDAQPIELGKLLLALASQMSSSTTVTHTGKEAATTCFAQ